MTVKRDRGCPRSGSFLRQSTRVKMGEERCEEGDKTRFNDSKKVEGWQKAVKH